MSKVIITDANRRVGLYATRSLGRKNIDVTATDVRINGTKPLSFFSKYCKNGVYTPNTNDEENFIKFMLKLSEGHDVLIPCLTGTMEPISKHLIEFRKHIKVPIMDHDNLKNALDKSLTFKIAIENGIPCPRTYCPKNIENLEWIAQNEKYPLVIKYREKHAAGVAYVNSSSELLSKYKEMHKIEPFPLIQEYIKGAGVGFFALFNEDSKPRAVFAHKRLREYPISGGISSFCESIDDPMVKKYGLKLLTAMNWYGVAMVEFKIDERDNIPKLMEINPRFWGSMALPISAGVDFPYLLYKLAIDGDIKSVNSYKVGLKTRFFFIDMISCAQLFRKEENKIRVLYDTIQPFFDKEVNEGVLSFDDPLPSLEYMKDRISKQVSKFVTKKKVTI